MCRTYGRMRISALYKSICFLADLLSKTAEPVCLTKLYHREIFYPINGWDFHKGFRLTFNSSDFALGCDSDWHDGV